MLKQVVYGMVAVLAVSPVLAQTPPREGPRPTPRARTSTTQALLDQRVPEVSFEEAPLEQVMDWVTDFTKANFIVRWEKLQEAGVGKDKTISIKVKNLRLSQVLWLIMNQAGGADVKLAYRASGNLLVLSTQEDLGQEMITRVYDVSDLLIRAPRFVNPNRLDIGQALSQIGQGGQGGGGGGGQNIFQSQGGGGGGTSGRQEEGRMGGAGGETGEMTQLVQLITDTIEPDTWVTAGGRGTITPFRNQIIVRNTILVHQRLGGAIEEGD